MTTTSGTREHASSLRWLHTVSSWEGTFAHWHDLSTDPRLSHVERVTRLKRGNRWKLVTEPPDPALGTYIPAYDCGHLERKLPPGYYIVQHERVSGKLSIWGQTTCHTAAPAYERIARHGCGLNCLSRRD